MKNMKRKTEAQEKVRIFIAPPTVTMTNRNVKRKKKFDYTKELENYS